MVWATRSCSSRPILRRSEASDWAEGLQGAKPEAFLLDLPAAGDIGEEDGDRPLLRGADAEGVDVVPSVVQVPRCVLEPLRLTRAGDAPVDLEPVLLVARLELSHPLARGAVQPCVPLEGRVDFQEAVVDRLAHPV